MVTADNIVKFIQGKFNWMEQYRTKVSADGRYLIKHDGNSHYFIDNTDVGSPKELHIRMRMIGDDLVMGELRNDLESVYNTLISTNWEDTQSPIEIAKFIIESLKSSATNERYNVSTTACIDKNEYTKYESIVSYIEFGHDLNCVNKTIDVIYDDETMEIVNVRLSGFATHIHALNNLKNQIWED